MNMRRQQAAQTVGITISVGKGGTAIQQRIAQYIQTATVLRRTITHTSGINFMHQQITPQ
jgi:hypothetical protein